MQPAGPRTAANGNWVDRAQLVARMAENALHYRVLNPDVASDAPVLAGSLRVAQLRPGLSLKCTDLHDLHDMTTEARLGESLNLVLVLAGSAEARFGAQPVSIGRGQDGADAALIALARPELFVRRSQRGRYERKVGITMEPEWLAASGLESPALDAFRRRHLAVTQWQPSPRAQAIAEQMIRPPRYSEALQQLYLESRALELIAEALAQIERMAPASVVPSTRGYERLRALREWLDSGEADGLSVHDIATRAGMSEHTLQEQFRASFGSSVFDYLRQRRLEQARFALETQGISIAQAAWQAGYSSAANFSTAFRRHFGITPKQARRG